MQIQIKVFPQAKKSKVVEDRSLFADTGYKVYVTAPAVDGKANKAVIEALAEHFGVKKGRIEIIKGLKSRLKTIKINDDLR